LKGQWFVGTVFMFERCRSYRSNSANKLPITCFDSGIPSFTLSQTTSRSTPKYACINLSRMPAKSFHGTEGYFCLISSGTFFAASPIISRARITAYCVLISPVNYRPMNRVASYFIPLTIASKSIGSFRSSYGVIFQLGFAYEEQTF